MSTIDTGLSRQDAERLAPDLLRRLREGEASAMEERVDSSLIDVLYAACEVISSAGENRSAEAMNDTDNLYRYLGVVAWPEPNVGGRAELKAQCALAGWRVARRFALPPVAEAWATRIIANVNESPILKDRVERAAAVVESDCREHDAFQNPF